MSEYPRSAEQLLATAGWVLGRSVDISGYVEVLASQEYPVSDAARSCLRQFGGLKIKFLDDLPVGKVPNCLVLDPPVACLHQIPENIADDSGEVGEPLCLIGETDDGLSSVAIGPSGRIYIHADEIMTMDALSPGEFSTVVRFIEARVLI